MVKNQKSFKVNVSPNVISWAIDTSGWENEELASRLKIAENTLDAWRTGDGFPTYKQLENLASILKRPVTALLLPSPPVESPAPPDFRMLPGRSGNFEKETILAIRKARRLQKSASEMMENIGESNAPRIRQELPTSNPLKIADELRAEMGITEDLQKKWKDTYAAFRNLRTAIESMNILVFQMKMPIKDVRGFALVDELPAIIVVSSSDHIVARNFTLIHELGHVILKKSGIDMGAYSYGSRSEGGIEKWCNDFASEFLLPRERFFNLIGTTTSPERNERKIGEISNQFKVSKLMIFTKMLRLDILSQKAYNEIREKMEIGDTKKKAGGSGQPSEERCLNEKGGKFVSLVRNNIEKGDISYYDAVDLLSVKVGVVDKVLSKSTG